MDKGSFETIQRNRFIVHRILFTQDIEGQDVLECEKMYDHSKILEKSTDKQEEKKIVAIIWYINDELTGTSVISFPSNSF